MFIGSCYGEWSVRQSRFCTKAYPNVKDVKYICKMLVLSIWIIALAIAVDWHCSRVNSCCSVYFLRCDRWCECVIVVVRMVGYRSVGRWIWLADCSCQQSVVKRRTTTASFSCGYCECRSVFCYIMLALFHFSCCTSHSHCCCIIVIILFPPQQIALMYNCHHLTLYCPCH